MCAEFADRQLARNPIAIVGMSGLFPMAHSHREFWQNIVDGTDCTEEVPESRWRLKDYYDPDPAAPDKTYSRRGGFLPDVEFDPLEFGIPPTQLGVTSTMQLLSLGVARDLLADAGASGSVWYDPSRTGVVLGVTGAVPLIHPLSARLSTPALKEVVRSCGLSEQDADEIAGKYVKAFAPWEENSFPGLLANVSAGRVANRLGLGGMNCTVDAACAASLAAIRLAVAELADGRADMMIAGGVDTESSVFMYMCFSKVGALSRSDRISPFSDSADGTVLGEGIGMVGLRRLADAERDGNRIYAVLRGIGSSSDGRALSIYAPRAEGQRVALDRAYADADCTPDSVELFEAHATGTVVGDRTELTALGELLGSSSEERHFAALGSVKSQIGHTKATAGTASLMKVAFALHQKVLPGTINVEGLNDRIDFTEAPFYVNTRTRPWILDPDRPLRRAGVSAMGFGGTNFHLVLSEHETDRAPRVLHRTPMAHLWHAPDPAGLIEALIEGAPSADGGDIPATHARVGFVSRDDEHAAELRNLAIEQLRTRPESAEWSHPKGVFFRRQAIPEPKVGAIFAGQGSQYLEMGMEAVLNNPIVADAFDRANATFAGAGLRLAKVVFPPPTFDTDLRKRQEADLRRTEYAQPAIGALSVGQFRCLSELGLECAAFAGHSFGELTALWAAGSLSLDDYFRLARARGQAMSSSSDDDPGAMVAVAADREQVSEILAGFADLVVCNHNAPDQVVVGGGTEDARRLLRECRDRGVDARRLPVAAAFHTHHVAHAVDRFGPEVAAVSVGRPRGPVYANSPGAAYGDDPAANGATLVRQLLEPVEFVAVLERMRAAGITVFVEFGPKQVLSQFVRRTLGDDVQVIAADAGALGDSAVALKQAAVRLAVLGVALSGLNRYTEPPVERAVPSGMSVTISGQEYVPEDRRTSYLDALKDGYRASLPAEPVIAQPELAPAGGSVPAIDEAPVTLLEDAMNNPVDQQLAVHSQYLESQLRVGEHLAQALRQPIDQHTVAAMTAIARQSEAIGRTHARASEILAGLAGLESGPAPAPWTPAADAEVVLDAGVGDQVAVAPTWTETPRIEAPQPVVTVQVSSPEPQIVVGPAEERPRVDLGGVLVEVIAEKTGYPVGMVDRSMDMETDLGVDSIKRVQVIAAVRERVPGLPALGAEQLGELRTVDQVVTFLTAGVGGADPKAHEAGAATPRHVVDLARLPVIDLIDQPYREDPVAVLFGGGDGDALAAGMTARGWTVRRAYNESDLDELLTGDVDLCLGMIGSAVDWTITRRHLVATVLFAKRAAALLAPERGRAAFVTVTRLDGALGLNGTAGLAASLSGGVGGVVKTLAAERSELFCRWVDVSPDLSEERLVDAVMRELRDAAVDTAEVGVDRTGGRWTVVPGRYGPAHRSSPVGPMPASTEISLTHEDLLVVTGGARGVTADCVRALAARTEARFLLLGRTELTAEPGWAAEVADGELRQAALTSVASSETRTTPMEVQRIVDDLLARREIRKTLAALGDRGTYLAVDISDAAAVATALSWYRDEITGLVHGAGVLADAKLTDKTAAQIERVFGPKLDGLRNVLDAVNGRMMLHLVLFTSVAGLLGNPGQADYAAANEALVRFAAGWKRANPAAHVTAIDWAAWDGGMVGAELRELFEGRGIPLLAAEAGARAFAEQFTEPRREDVCVLIGEDAALGGNRITPSPAFSAGRDVERIVTHPVLQAHWIDPHVVLPATFGLGWLINVVERAHPGLCVVHAHDFQVLKGIVFDGTAHGGHRVDVEASTVDGDQVLVRAVVRTDLGGGRLIPRYAVNLTLAVAPAKQPEVTVPATTDGPDDGLDIYRDAIQFHAPPLQGMRKVLARTRERMVLLCRLPDAEVDDGAYHGRLHSPVLADLILQSPGVLGREMTGGACLPLAVARADWFAPLPGDTPFFLLVEDPRAEHGMFRVTVTAVALDGKVLQRYSDITFAATKDTAEKFRASVRRWAASDERQEVGVS